MSNWDVIVIGSGIGGLAAAAALAKESKRVWSSTAPARLTQAFVERHGYRLDVGVHYIGGADGEPGPAKKISTRSAHIRWRPWRTFTTARTSPASCSSWSAPGATLVGSLKAHFPQELEGIDRYFESMRAARKALEAVFARALDAADRGARPDVVEEQRDRALGRSHRARGDTESASATRSCGRCWPRSGARRSRPARRRSQSTRSRWEATSTARGSVRGVAEIRAHGSRRAGGELRAGTEVAQVRVKHMCLSIARAR